MKRVLLKYTIIIVIIIGSVVGLYYYAGQQNSKKKYSVQEYTLQKTSVIKSDTLHLCIVDMDTFDPIISKNQNVQDITKLIFEPLLQLDENNKIELGLAKEWAKLNDLEYLIKLKDNVLWQDGKKMVAQDVKDTIHQIKENTDSVYFVNVEAIQEVEVIDDSMIKITLDREIPFFEYQLIFPILPSAEKEENKSIGTGRYQIINWTEQEITLKEYESWWSRENATTNIKKIKVYLYDSIASAYQNFKEGSIDLLTTSNLEIEQYIGNMGFKSKQFMDRQYDFVACNMEDIILKRKEVREAISYAIDQEEIIQSIYKGKYEIAEFPLNGALKKTSSESSYQPEKAKQVLIEAGWKEREDGWQLSQSEGNIQLALTLTVCKENEKRVQVAEKIKEQLEQVGIPINLKLVSLQQYNACIAQKQYELLLAGIQTSFSPNLNNYLGVNNVANFEQEEINQILSEIEDIQEEGKIKEKYNRIVQILEEEKPYIGLYFQTKTMVYQKNLMGTITPTRYQLFYHMDSWAVVE